MVSGCIGFVCDHDRSVEYQTCKEIEIDIILHIPFVIASMLYYRCTLFYVSGYFLICFGGLFILDRYPTACHSIELDIEHIFEMEIVSKHAQFCQFRLS